MNQKGFANIILVVAIMILAVLATGSGIYLWQKSSFSKDMAKQSQQTQEENQKLQLKN